MLEMQLYIKSQRVDLFKDESVTLTDSIQNVRDIEKIFTSFSQSFSLPASKTNNKIFKHYYNFNIEQNFAFDARVKTPANIELNTLPFRRGYIKLEGVDLKDNVPYLYRVTFFGEIVKLKDAIGESKLSDLQGLGTTNYSSLNVITMLRRDPELGYDTVVPLITHTQRLYYDSVSHNPDDGNLYWHTGSGTHLHGVKWNELKPAMRVNKIIEAIEQTFPQIEFTNDFFKNEFNGKFNKLFMWISRKSGAVENLNDDFATSTPIEFPSSQSSLGVFGSQYTSIYMNFGFDWNYVTLWRYSIVPTSNDPYIAEVYSVFGELVYQSSVTTGTLIINKSDLNITSFDYIELNLYIRTSQAITFSQIRWEGTYYAPRYPRFIQDSLTVTASNITTGTEFLFDYKRQMPDITVLNFLSGLFKMFNLTAFVQDDGKIKVQPLNEYYNDTPAYRDITEYVGIEKSSVDAALPYRQVKFEFGDTKSFLANKYGEINNKAWGLLQYNNERNDLTGSLYKITAPFGHFLYERLTDNGTSQQTNIQWGYSVDKSQNALLPQPLLFYPINVDDNPSISFINEVDAENNPVSKLETNARSMPFNHYGETPAQGDGFQLNFSREVSEWTGDFNFGVTLFSAYEKYIQSIFDPRQRITKVEVMLPLAVLLSIKMNDRIIIAGNNYIINKLTTNLSTGKSQLELINDFNIETYSA